MTLTQLGYFPLQNVGQGTKNIYSADAPQRGSVLVFWADPQERYDILMNSFTERTWMAVVMGQEVNMATYVKYPPRKSQSLTYNDPITLSQYQRFNWVREQLAKVGFSLPLPTGN